MMKGNAILAAGTLTAGEAVIAAILIVLTVAVFLTAVWLLSRTIHREKGKSPLRILALILVGGLAVRLAFAFTVTGFRDDISGLVQIGERLFSGTLTGYYAGGDARVYPLSFYIVGLFSGFGYAGGLESSSMLTAALIKLPLIFADIVTALILYKIAHRFTNEYVGLVVAGLYCFCPAFFIGSAVWGSYLCLLFPPLLLSLYMLVRKRPLLAILFYSLCLLISSEAMYLYPVYLIYYGYQFVRSIRANLRERKPLAEAIRDSELSLAYKLPVYFIGAFLLKYLISMPFAIADFSANPFLFVFGLYLKPLTSAVYYTENGLSIYNILARNGVALGEFPIVAFVVCFAVLIVAIGCVVYFSKKNRAVVVFYAAFIPFTLAVYYFGFTAMSFMVVSLLLLMSFLLIKDRRILQVLLVTVTCFTMVSVSVMAGFGQLNADPERVVDGLVFLNTGFGLAVMIVASVFTVAAHIYTTLVLLDVSMSNTRKLLTGHPQIGYFAGIKRLFKEGADE